MDSYSIAFSTRLAELRAEKKLTLQQLGEKLGVIKQTIGHWESGYARPNMLMLIKLADALGVSLDYLTGRTDDPKLK